MPNEQAHPGYIVASMTKNPTDNHKNQWFNITAFLRRHSGHAIVIGAVLCAMPLLAQLPVTVVVDAHLAGPLISSNFAGLRHEMSLVLPGENGKYFFSRENKPLVQMFRTLGIRNLRVRGNTTGGSDPLPSAMPLKERWAIRNLAGQPLHRW